MTIEEVVAALEAEGWHVWTLHRAPGGSWSCRIVDPIAERRSNGMSGAAGFDRECWRSGTGPTMLTAITAAGAGLIFVSNKEDDLDLDAMLA